MNDLMREATALRGKWTITVTDFASGHKTIEDLMRVGSDMTAVLAKLSSPDWIVVRREDATNALQIAAHAAVVGTRVIDELERIEDGTAIHSDHWIKDEARFAFKLAIGARKLLTREEE